MRADLSETVAFITGGGRGIGRAAALALAEAGAAVAVSARSEAEIGEVAAEIDAAGGRGFAVAADVRDAGAVERAARAAEAALGPVNLVICNAGVGGAAGPLWDVDPEAWRQVLDVNVMGVVHTVRALVGGMVERGEGRILHMGSLVGARPSGGVVSYAASKAALLRIADGLDVELEGTGVRSFAMSPGLVRTEMTADIEAVMDIPDDAWVPIERSAALIVRLAAGDADALHGLMIHAEDDLDALLEHVDEIRAKGWYALRMVRGLDDPAPV